MNLHEYQGKQLFAEYGLPVSKGYAVDSPKEAAEACDKIGGTEWVVKAQVHAGGRGKAGGVKLVRSKDEARAFAQQWLDKRLVTYQTDANGQPVSKILVEAATDIDKELYLGAVVDRSSRRIVFMASTEGGVDIEKVAHDTPEKILKATIDPLVGAQPFQARELAFQLGLKGDQVKQFVHIFVGLAKLFQDYDLALLEVNPLVIKKDGNLHCLDAKLNIDGNASIDSRSCATWPTLPRTTHARRMRPSGNSITSRSTATSVAWSTVPAWRWGPWTSSTCTAVVRRTSSMSAVAQRKSALPKRSRHSLR